MCIGLQVYMFTGLQVYRSTVLQAYRFVFDYMTHNKALTEVKSSFKFNPQYHRFIRPL